MSFKKMVAGNKIYVPDYQRAYSWEAEFDRNNSRKRINVFLSDLEEYNKSNIKTPYYFGHFLFEEKEPEIFGVIDGQQRLTTIVILLCALFTRIREIRILTNIETEYYEDMIKSRSTYKFKTASIDNQLFKDYVIDQIQIDKNELKTNSARRIVNAFDYFTQNFLSKNEDYLTQMLFTISEAICIIYLVKENSDAIKAYLEYKK